MRVPNLITKIVHKHPSLKNQLKALYCRIIPKIYKKHIQGKNNKIVMKYCAISNVTFDIIGSNNMILIEDNVILSNLTILIRGCNNLISIQNNVRISGGSLWQEDSFTEIIIGKNSTIESAHLAATENMSKITIGEDCMFAYDIEIRTGDSHSIINYETNKRINYAKNILIGNHVWIAAHCIILKGVNIHNNSVIATGSIVTKSILDENVIIGGNPAQVIKKNITWKRERI